MSEMKALPLERTPEERADFLCYSSQEIGTEWAEWKKQIAHQIREAVEAERYECMLIVERFGDPEIAEAIRARGKP